MGLEQVDPNQESAAALALDPAQGRSDSIPTIAVEADALVLPDSLLCRIEVVVVEASAEQQYLPDFGGPGRRRQGAATKA
jgi:hypothetical protein